jgi:phosphate:Na+ symporter
MGALAQNNFALGCDQLVSYDPKICEKINEEEDYLDQFTDDADHFMIGLAKTLENERDDLHLDMLMQAVPNFERIGDYATNFVELAEKLNEEKSSFSDMAKHELNILRDAVVEILDITVHAFNNNDNVAATTVEPLEETIDDMVVILRDRHTKRLKKGECSVGVGLIFMEALTYLERTADQCSSIAIAMLARDNKAIMHNHHEYLRSIHQSSETSYLEQREMRHQQYIVPLLDIKQ